MFVSYTVDTCGYNHTGKYAPPVMAPKALSLKGSAPGISLPKSIIASNFEKCSFPKIMYVFVRHNQREYISIVPYIAQ